MTFPRRGDAKCIRQVLSRNNEERRVEFRGERRPGGAKRGPAESNGRRGEERGTADPRTMARVPEIHLAANRGPAISETSISRARERGGIPRCRFLPHYAGPRRRSGTRRCDIENGRAERQRSRGSAPQPPPVAGGIREMHSAQPGGYWPRLAGAASACVCTCARAALGRSLCAAAPPVESTRGVHARELCCGPRARRR